MKVFIIIRQVTTFYGQEMSHNEYSDEVFEVFADRQLAQHMIDYLRSSGPRADYLLREYEVTAQPSVALINFMNRKKKENLEEEIALHQRKISELQEQLKNSE